MMSKNGSLIASEILIVDDEEDIRDLVAGILHDEGYTTRVAGDSTCSSSAFVRVPLVSISWLCLPVCQQPLSHLAPPALHRFSC